MDSLKIGEMLAGRYRLVEMVGKGSFGEVWHAYDEYLKMGVAVKVYFVLDEKGNQDLKKEFKNTNELNHPNLLRPTFFGVSGDRSYIIMPYCPTTAAKLIGCCNEMMVWEFVRDVANGLAYLHGQGIVHHDIKPDNILLDENGRFVITDFGVSTKARDLVQGDNEELMGGTVGYMGPEMFRPYADSVAATDIWAFGATIYELLTGELPFYGLGGRGQANDAKQIEIPYRFVSDNLEQLVRDCMAKDPWDRPRAQEIADYTKILFDERIEHPGWKDYFAEVRRVGGDTEPAAEKAKSNPEQIKKRKLWWIPAAAAVVVGIIVALWLTRPAPMQDSEMLGIMDVIPEDSLQYDSEEEASYLLVNGSENPKLSAGSKKTQKTIPVQTDGSFTVELPKNCDWLSLVETTDSSIVLLFSTNENAKGRSNKIKVIAGELTEEVSIYQKPDEVKASKANLTPANGILKSSTEPASVSGNKPKIDDYNEDY